MNLIEALKAAGHVVVAMSPRGSETAQIEAHGVHHIHLPLSPQGTNAISELRTVLALRRLLDASVIDIVLTSTPKGNLYTALANTCSSRHQIANVSGLGSSFLRDDWVSRVVDLLYARVFGRIDYVFFENPTDHAEFLQRTWVQPGASEVIPGLGVDLKHFASVPVSPEEDGSTNFLMVARLIGDKGVREYVEAAQMVRRTYPRARFRLLGDAAADNPTCIPADEVARWVNEGHVTFHEHVDDVRPHIAKAHCVVLPSYREGMSRTLLEAGAMGRPLIASDVPGCREAIDHESNGLLCAPRSAPSLAEQVERFIRLTQEEKEAMGRASRAKIASRFDERIVIERYLKALARLESR